MRDYLWVFILSAIALVSTGVFLLTITKSAMMIKKLKLPKTKLIFNFTLLISAIADIGLIIYVFYLVKDQVTAFS